MNLQLAGKRALVTGSNTGIGKGIATVLAGEGAIVVVHGRRRDRAEAVAEEVRAAGGTAHVAIGDLATEQGSADVVRDTMAALRGIDILVNNIGGTEASGGGMKTFFDVLPDQWAGSMEQNLIGAVRMVHAFVPAMRDAKWGRVINVASAGATSPPAAVPEYCAAKAAVLNMTVSLSRTLERSGVTVNTVSPGCTRTEMFERTLIKMGDANGWPDDLDEREQKFMDLGIFPCASASYGRPSDIGTLVAFMASPLGGFINGANYRIDGGQCQSVN